MTFPLQPDVVANAYLEACLQELSALKPGNVHIHGAGHGMTVGDFKAAAEASVKSIADPHLNVGERIEEAVTASLTATQCNINLGIILLTSPLANAVFTGENRSTPPTQKEAFSPIEALKTRLKTILDKLSVGDANRTFQAIALANPGGLGAVENHDVHNPATVTLKEAMRAAAQFDRIALAYTNGFQDVFKIGLPTLEKARKYSGRADLAITTLHMTLLAHAPDTHVARKFGIVEAERLQSLANSCRNHWDPIVSADGFDALLTMDQSLKSDGINPGTTADFVVATLFAANLIKFIR